MTLAHFAERLLALLVGGALADAAFVGVEDGASEGVQLLALVDLEVLAEAAERYSDARRRVSSEGAAFWPGWTR